LGKVESLLKSNIENIDFAGLMAVKKEYYELLEKNKFPKSPENQNFFEMIHYFKRKDENNPVAIGPYKNITLFEAANRIASDLVIINGLLQLIKEHQLINPIMTLRLGITHQKGKGDFTIKVAGEEFEGEAFNVAPSFLSIKLNKTNKKWKDGNLKYILINSDAFEYGKYKKENERILKIEKWHE
jgi:hypothetical protein